MKRMFVLFSALVVAVPFLFYGCGSGSDGSAGAPAPTSGTVSGTVTDAVKADALAGVSVKASLDSGGTNVVATTTTDAAGAYTMSAPIGGVYITFSKAFYTSPGGMFVGVGSGLGTLVSASMSEAASGGPSVSFAAVAGDDFGYGQTAALAANGADPNGDTLTYVWSNETGGTPKLGSVTGAGTSGSITFPTLTESMIARVSPSDGADISGYRLEDRFGILPIIPDTRGAITAKVTVNDGRGRTASASITLNAASVLTGVRNVPIGTKVYLNSGHDTANAWTGTGPGGAIVFDNAAARTPWFLAAAPGNYTVFEGGNSMTITAGNWEGVITGGSGDTVVTDPTCTQVCHNPTGTAPDYFAPWKGTGHATQFTRGINGGEGTSGSGCFACHTVGYDPGSPNNGFYNVALAKGFVFPSNRVAGNWDNMVRDFPEVAKLANIQCENCHGPQNSGAHASSAPSPFLSDRIAFNAEVCGTCHGRTTHNIYSQWNTRSATGRGHSNKLLADDEGTGSTSCARCHGAQGFFLYQNKLKASSGFTLTAGDIANITPANVQPQTCTACHDPHNATNPNQLRIYNNTPGTLNLPAGFRVTGFGKGALCVTCHNTRNGAQTGSSTATYLHEDGEAYNGGNPTGYSAPHTASQGDVFAGRNAYFMGATLPMVSRHAAIEDTCVGCHMKNQPKIFYSHGTPTPKGHLFRIVDADMLILCSNCHGANQVNGEGIQASIEAGLANLAAKIGAAGLAKINSVAGGIIRVRAYDSATDLYSSSSSSNSNVSIDVTANPVTAVGIEEGHGQIEFHLTLTTPITITWTDGSTTTTNQFGVQLGSLKDNQATPVALYALSGNMVRAGWNYFLIEADDSKGIHNPTFAQQVLNNTLAKDLSN